MPRPWYVVALLSLLPPTNAHFEVAHPNIVSGTVLAANDSTALQAVKVSAWSGGKVVGETRTDVQGRYRLILSSAAPIDAIYYEYTLWPTQHVQQLSGSRDHVINKLLQPTASQMPLLPALGTLAAYESLYYISDGGTRLDAETRSRVRQVLDRLEVPAPILRRLEEVRTLWGRV